MKENILYVYATDDNDKHVDGIANEYNLKKSVVVNKIIEGHRTGKKPVFKKHVPKYVQKAEQWEYKKKAD